MADEDAVVAVPVVAAERNEAADDWQASLEFLSKAASSVEAAQAPENAPPSFPKVKNAILHHIEEAQKLIKRVHGEDPGNDRHVSSRMRGGWRFTLASLIEALLLARLCNNAEELPDVLVRSVHFSIGTSIAELLSEDIQSNLQKIPSAASLSRARLKLVACCVKLNLILFVGL